jgi:tetratricopeptide (TPR) repeat protein
VRSPTGIVYEPGTPPTRSRFSQTAALLLSQGVLDRALAIAEEGIASDTANPIHYFLAGLAQVRIGMYEDAHRNFTIAQRIYPAYELEIEPERRAAWVRLYNDGTDAYDNGEVERALEAWELATMIYDLEHEAPRNLVSLYLSEGRYDDAIRVSELTLAGLQKVPATRFLDSTEVRERGEASLATEATLGQLLMATSRFEDAEPILRRQLERDPGSVDLRADLAAALAGQGRAAAAVELYTELLQVPDLESARLFELGISLFRSQDYDLASQAFGRLTLLRPSSRDVWFNYSNALFGAREWDSLAAAGARLVELDPLGENAGLITARALFEVGDTAAAVLALNNVDATPVYVGELLMRPVQGATRVTGKVVGNVLPPGTPLTLRFVFYDDARLLGNTSVAVNAPAEGASSTFEVQFGSEANAYRYEFIPPPEPEPPVSVPAPVPPTP